MQSQHYNQQNKFIHRISETSNHKLSTQNKLNILYVIKCTIVKRVKKSKHFYQFAHIMSCIS